MHEGPFFPPSDEYYLLLSNILNLTLITQPHLSGNWKGNWMNPFHKPFNQLHVKIIWQISVLLPSFSTAAHGIFRHGHLPGVLCGCVAGLPHSAHQDQTQAKEKPGESRKHALITTWAEVQQADSLNKFYLLSHVESRRPYPKFA